MPYIQRDPSGRVIALYIEPPADHAEQLPANHPDVLTFLESDNQQLNNEDRRRLLADLDTSMIRVLEDLMDVLIEKRIIMLTDLPEQAQRKIMARKETRGRLFFDAGDYPSENDNILF